MKYDVTIFEQKMRGRIIQFLWIFVLNHRKII